MSIPSSFTVRSTIGITSQPQTNYLTVQDNAVSVSNVQNASIFVISQINNSNTTFYHQIRYGHCYLGTAVISGITRIVLQQQPYNWYFLSTTATPTPITQSDVDLLQPDMPFVISNNAGFGIYITNTNKLGLVSVSPIINLSKQIILGIKSASQPVIDQVRYLTGGPTFSPAPSAASIYINNLGNITINGFKSGVIGQTLTVFSSGGWIITVNNQSGLVSTGEQIITPSGGSESTIANGSFTFIYDGTYWRSMAQQYISGGNFITLADGSAAAPSLNFINDINTGIFHELVDDNTMRFTNGGVEPFAISPAAIVPALDNTLDIGISGTNEMRNVFTKKVASESSDLNVESALGNIVMNSLAVVPLVDNAINMGSSALRWQNVFTLVVSANASDLILAGSSVKPPADNTTDFGLSGTRWRNVYTEAIGSGNQDLTINTNLNVKPGADNTYNFGTSTERWLSVAATSIDSGASDLTINVSGSVIPSGSNKSIGNNAAPWTNVYTDTVRTNAITAQTSNDIVITATFGKGVAPYADDSLSLGISGTNWSNVYTRKVQSNGVDLTIGPSGYSVIPESNVSMDLGSSANFWKNTYTNNLYISGITSAPVFEEGVISPTLTTTDSNMTGTFVYSGKWSRVHKTITANANIVWSGITVGTGSLIINNGIPPGYVPTISGIPGTITYAGLSGINGTLQVIANTTPGKLDLRVTDNTGTITSFPATGISSMGYMVYSFSYSI